jgi:lipoate-protein ligase A
MKAGRKLSPAEASFRTKERGSSSLAPVPEARTFDPLLNLERDSINMKTAEVPSFRVWRSTDSVVLGRFLQPGDEVYVAHAEMLGVPILHRSTGGGAVFHDLGNINYSIYLPRGHSVGPGIEDSLMALSFPVIDLLEALGVPWSWEPPNNVYVLGRKISGSAQARSGGRLLHHGTLLVNTDLQRMGHLLKPGGRSRIAPVINLSEVVGRVTVAEVEDLMRDLLKFPDTLNAGHSPEIKGATLSRADGTPG